jgi:ABC-type polysaccharide/polyol phosphate export permease
MTLCFIVRQDSNRSTVRARCLYLALFIFLKNLSVYFVLLPPPILHMLLVMLLLTFLLATYRKE